MAAPLHFAAIDAGSNAIRLVIARASSPSRIEILKTERYSLRLGHSVFVHHRFEPKTIKRGIEAFRHFRRLLDRYGVRRYRAVATSATREAQNRREFLERVRREARITLDVIGSAEEARLVRNAVHSVVGSELSPRMILDLGGGSLDLDLLRQGEVERSVGLPLGTVRLMETYDFRGSMSEEDIRRLRAHILNVLATSLRERPNLESAVAVACGGNAEALANLAPGPQLRGIPTLNIRLLRERLWEITGMSVPKRMKAFRVREDRADVMAIAAVVFTTLARWYGVSRFLVPGVGVREGILLDLVREHFARAPVAQDEAQASALRGAVERFAARLGDEAEHSRQVSRLALSLFDQLRSIHGMGPEMRLVLELGARLHDIGRVVNREEHHKHGEYLVRSVDLPELRGWRRAMVACLVRYHNRRSEPDMGHKLYASLDPQQRANVRALSALLRLAEGLDDDHKQSVLRVDVETHRREAVFRVQTRSASNAPAWGARRKAGLFEEEFGLRAVFTRSLAARKVA
ncbi:MAG: Ppx/GppA family phosphatase [Acidobacteria bacterium]|nr:Ppx/GppA family phosphatase [Acidobacteriota bacterium]MBI3663719.1 Ppx/GppA family phosphatase [Acidobacteriota bacterium]